jgi:hypothetical protein
LDQPWWGSGEALALTISEAARICGLKRRAIRRRHEAGEFVHSYRDAEGTWRIPLNDLIAAGLEPNLESDPEEPRVVSAPTSHIERLRTEVAVLRERVRALEIIAREREERVEDLRTILRMLPAPGEIDELSPAGADEVSGTEALASPEVEKETVEEVTLEEVFGVEDPGVEAPSRPPTQAPGASPYADAASPFDAARAPSPPRSADPIVVIPEAIEPVPIPSEDDRQRPAELLQGAMSLWWPAPQQRAQDEGWSQSPPDVPDEWRDAASDLASRQVEQGDEASPRSEETDQQEDGIISNPFPADSYEEAPYEWMDPAFDRTPRHRRRRLGRFFRRDRRPR